MKTLTLVALTGLGLAIGSQVRAQDEARPAPAPAAALSQTDAWLDKKVDIEVKDASPADLLKTVLEKIGLGDTKIPEGVAKREGKYSLSMNGVRAGDALQTACQIAGVRSIVRIRDGKPSLTLTPGGRDNSFFIPWTGQAAAPDRRQLEALVRGTMPRPQVAMPAVRASNLAGRYAIAVAGPKLPDKRVSLDVRKHNLRDLLKDVLKQADVDFILEDGVPDDVKKSFTFEDVPLSAALDAICRSADLGWWTETKDKKLVVHIGKSIGLFRSRGVSEMDPAFARYTDAVALPHVYGRLADSFAPMPENWKAFEELHALDAFAGRTVPFQSFDRLPAAIDSSLEAALRAAGKQDPATRKELDKARKEIEKARKEAMKEAEKARKEAEKARKEEEKERNKDKEKEIERTTEPEKKTPQPFESVVL